MADGVDLPPIKRTQMQTWDDNDITRFLEAAKESPYYALFYTALFTGMRRSELLGLAWRDVDFLYCQLSITRSLHHLKDGSYVFTQPKSAKSRRTIALSPSVVLLLKEHKEKQELERVTLGKLLADDDLVFSTLEGKPLRPNTITRAWVTLSVRAGVKAIRLHDARHTHASIMLKQGIHPKIVQERLGHSSIEMTLDIYSHVMPGIQEAAAKRFDDIFNHKLENEAAKSD
ncbi:MAG: site-specific integrase [Dehalococcoidia bacterium]